MEVIIEVFAQHYFIIFIIFCFVKALENAMLHDYASWKKRLGIPNGWDWWLNPNVSWMNKYKGRLFWFITWSMITPVSDFWHTLWTASMSAYCIYIMVEVNFYQGIATGVVGVFVVFNFFYPFFRRKEIF